jgi:hypothetical protein
MKKNPNTTLAGSGLPRTDTALPERDANGQIIDYQERIDELPLVTAPPTSPEFTKQLKAFFKQAVKTCGLSARSASEQYRNIVSALGLKLRGRPPKPEGAQTSAERQHRHRQHKIDWGWLPFPILPHAGYMVIDTSPEDEMPSFDIHRARIVVGCELQRMLEDHRRAYPDPKSSEDRGLRFETELNGVTVLRLDYPDDRISYIAPMYETPPTSESVLAGRGLGSLNRGLFMKQAPKGKGKVVSGWRQTGYDTNTAEREAPSVDEDFSNYANEFANEDDDNGAADNPGKWADQPEDKAEEVRPYEFRRRELDETVEEYRQDQDRDNDEDTDTDVLKCRICQEVLEGNSDDDALLFKHLEERHPDEYRRICRIMAEQFDKARAAEKKHERRLLEKQKHCLNDHDGMLAAHGPDAFCECGFPLCRGTHVKQAEEKIAERNAYRSTLSSQERLDASKRKEPTIYCKYCHKTLDSTDYYG